MQAKERKKTEEGASPILFNPCSAPATPVQTWGTRPEGRDAQYPRPRLERGTAGYLTKTVWAKFAINKLHLRKNVDPLI